ncbi:MAG: hypothetical protein AAFV90_26625 [Cyanobacteria bacterium J06634_5]
MSLTNTDWTRIDAMTDEDIDTSDIPPLTEEFFLKATLRMPQPDLTLDVISSKLRLVLFTLLGP